MKSRDLPCEPSASASIDRVLAMRLQRLGSIARGCHRRMGAPLSAVDLEEAIQEASLSAWQQRSRYRGDSDIDTWLYGLVRYRILDQIRRRQRTGCRVSELADIAEVPADPARGPACEADTGMARVVHGCLAELGTTLVSVYHARAIDGQSFVEISSSMNVGEAMIKARFYRSLPQMRRRLRSIWE